jgi:predicted RNase H-like nuclease
VVADALLPRVVERWASSQPEDGWRYALYVQREHAAIGAEWAAQAGCSALSCWLIAQHQREVDALLDDQSILADAVRVRALLAALQRADSDN